MDRREFVTLGLGAATAAAVRPVVAAAKGRTVDPRTVVVISDIHVPLKPAEQKYKTWVDDHEIRDYYWVKDVIRRHVEEILAMDPLPANVIGLGDISIAFAEDREYELCREWFAPLEQAGIRITHAMGNHDIRANFLKAFPEYAKTTRVPGKIVSKVETPDLDFILLDSLVEPTAEQRGHQEYLRQCDLGEEQLAWLKQEISASKKPLFVCAHHRAENLRISSLLAGSPKVFGYLYGHHHRVETHYAIENYSQGSRVLRTVGVGSFALDGDVGYAVVKTTPQGADMRFVQNGFWFPVYRPPQDRPQLWHEFVKDNNGRQVRFPFS